MCNSEDRTCDYEAGVTIKGMDRFINALAVALPALVDGIQEALNKQLTLKQKIAAGVPVDVREVFAAKAEAQTAAEPEPEEEPEQESEPIPVEQEEWFRALTELSVPYGALAAMGKYKESTGCTMCTHELESFLEAYLQKCAKHFAYWLTDMPSDRQAQREYLATKCWELKK